jgi:hypothetical protein
LAIWRFFFLTAKFNVRQHINTLANMNCNRQLKF